MPDLNMSHGKISDFVSFSLFGLALVIKLRDLDLDGKMSDFVSFTLFGFTFVIKQKFRFWKSLNTFMAFDKNDVRFDYVLSNRVWFDLSFVVWVELWQ